MKTAMLSTLMLLTHLLIHCDVSGQNEEIKLYRNGNIVKIAKNEPGSFEYNKRIDFYVRDLSIKDTIEIDISNTIFDRYPDKVKYDFYRQERKETLALSGYAVINSQRHFVLPWIEYDYMRGMNFVVKLCINDVKEKHILLFMPK